MKQLPVADIKHIMTQWDILSKCCQCLFLLLGDKEKNRKLVKYLCQFIQLYRQGDVIYIYDIYTSDFTHA